MFASLLGFWTCDIMAHAVVAMPTRARRMARMRRIAFQRKVESSAYIAEREGRAMVEVIENGEIADDAEKESRGVGGKACGTLH